jgi:2-polyprenyl-6-methoxyphenol hydroxylase-like FAD-dependent oxidoreductase
MTDTQVLIVGAGPTGLVLALRLVRHGVTCRIIDRNDGPGQASRALGVQARTLEFYQQLGFAEQIVAAGTRIDTIHVREHGEDVAKLTLKDMGAGLSPYPFLLSYAQDDHERFLVEKLRDAGVAVEWGATLEAFTQDDAGVSAILESRGARHTCHAAYLCGCDGARSTVREHLGLRFPGGTYDQPFYVADVTTDTTRSTDAFMNLGANGFVLMMPVRQAGAQRLIGLVPRQYATHTKLTFADVQASAEALLGVRVTQLNWFSTYRVHHRVAERFRVGRTFIVGDAGHIHSPAGGQGMNTGIGDAVNLSWKLAHVLQRRARPSLLDTYEPERISFARVLVQTTDRLFTNIVNPGLRGQFFRTWLIPQLAPLLARFSFVRRLMFRTISQVRINYRDSALSQGNAGDVRGGDRLPYVTQQTGDNFTALRSMDWQVHIYGTPQPDFQHMAATLQLPVHVFGWNDSSHDAGLMRSAAYLVRPDGYVALAMRTQNADAAEELRRYAATVFSS